MKLKDIVIQGTLTKFEVEQIAESMFGRKVSKSHTKDLSMPYDITLPEWSELPVHVRGFVLKAFLEADASIKMGNDMVSSADTDEPFE